MTITLKAQQQTFNICMDEPVDYGELGSYPMESRGLPTVAIQTPYHSTWLDNAKAKFLLGWRPPIRSEETNRRIVGLPASRRRSTGGLVSRLSEVETGAGIGWLGTD
jgi:hypothetical protein